jgi:hypothetical protein
MSGERVGLTAREQSALSLAEISCSSDWIAVGPGTGKNFFCRFPLLPSLALTFLGLIGVAALELFAVNSDRPAAVLFPVGVSETESFNDIVNAGGLPVRATRSVFGDGVVWIAAADDPEFFSNVRSNGALLVMNSQAFGGCLFVVPQ